VYERAKSYHYEKLYKAGETIEDKVAREKYIAYCINFPDPDDIRDKFGWKKCSDAHRYISVFEIDPYHEPGGGYIEFSHGLVAKSKKNRAFEKELDELIGSEVSGIRKKDPEKKIKEEWLDFIGNEILSKGIGFMEQQYCTDNSKSGPLCRDRDMQELTSQILQ
jgi:hypothetical protein